MKSVAGQSKGRKVLRKVSGKLPAYSASVRAPIALLGLVAFASLYFFGAGDSFLRQFWPFCILLGVTLGVLGDFLLHRRRWVVGDVSRIAGFVFVNLGMVLFVAWGWVSGGEAWFWYSTLVYGTFVILVLGWGGSQGWRGPRVR